MINNVPIDLASRIQILESFLAIYCFYQFLDSNAGAVLNPFLFLIYYNNTDNNIKPKPTITVNLNTDDIIISICSNIFIIIYYIILRIYFYILMINSSPTVIWSFSAKFSVKCVF